MGRISILLGAAALATLAVVGCGSDSNGAKPTPAPSQCVGVNAEFSASTFTSTQACKSDTATICGNDLPTIAGKCGASCFAAGGDDPTQASCVASCVNDGLSAGSAAIGAACMACYTGDVECARKNCAVMCGLAPTSDNCATCRITNGCTAGFYECSGLPLPGLSGAAGAGGT